MITLYPLAFDADTVPVFDVIFIDGLHEHSQVRKDALNSLDCIDENGWIAFHDFLPANYLEQHLPRLGNGWPWTGDCWKLAYELSQAKNIEFKIVEIDRGVGLMKKISNDYFVPDLSKDLIGFGPLGINSWATNPSNPVDNIAFIIAG